MSARETRALRLSEAKAKAAEEARRGTCDGCGSRLQRRPADARPCVPAAVEKTLAEVRKHAAELANDNWMFEHPRSNIKVLSQLGPPKQ